MPPGSAAGRFRPQRCSGIVSEVSVLVGTRPAKTRSRISSTVGPTCGAREVAAACAGRLSRGQPVVPGAEYQEAQQTPARALSRAWAYLDLKLIQRYVDINLLRPSHKWVQTLTVEGQTLQTNNQRSKPLGHRVSAYQKLAPRHRSEPFSIVLSVLKDWGLQYQGMKHDETSSPFFFFNCITYSFLACFGRVFSNDFHSCISRKRHHWPGSQDRLSTVNSGSLVHQASAVTWQVWQAGDQLIWILNFAHWEIP